MAAAMLARAVELGRGWVVSQPVSRNGSRAAVAKERFDIVYEILRMRWASGKAILFANGDLLPDTRDERRLALKLASQSLDSAESRGTDVVLHSLDIAV